MNKLLTYSDFLNESHYTDISSKNYLAFIKKYKKLLKDGKIDKYNTYVNFTNHDAQNINKTFSDKPLHTDPIGLYAYPIDYVLNYPADIRYGSTSKYIRVVEMSYKNSDILNLSKIKSEIDLEKHIYKLGYNYIAIDRYIKVLKKHFKETSNKYAKWFFDFIQYDIPLEKYEKLVEKFQKENPSLKYDEIILYVSMFDNKSEYSSYIKEKDINKYTFEELKTVIDDYYRYEKKLHFPLRTQKEQTEYIKKGGWNVVIDESKNENSAVINSSEPNQIVFLERKTFNVIDFMVNNLKEDDSSLYNKDEKTYDRKLASMIATELDDKLIGKMFRDDYRNIYFTVNGKCIKIYKYKPKSFYDRNMFKQKKHKEFKTSDVDNYQIIIIGEFGKFTDDYTSDKKFKEIATDIKNQFEREKFEDTENYGFQSYEKYNKAKEDEKDKRMREVRKEQKEMDIRHGKSDFTNYFGKLNDKYGNKSIENIIENEDEDYYFVHKICNGTKNLYNNKYKIDDIISHLDYDDDEIKLPDNQKYLFNLWIKFLKDKKDFLDNTQYNNAYTLMQEIDKNND